MVVQSGEKCVTKPKGVFDSLCLWHYATRVFQLIAFSLLLVFALYRPSSAVPASPHVFHAQQPDGTKIALYLRGDEHFNREEDAKGYTVLRQKGRYVYARRSTEGRLVPTSWEVGKANPRAKGLKKKIIPAKHIIKAMRARGPGVASAQSLTVSQVVQPLGEINNLVVMIRFADHQRRILPSSADLEVLFNAEAPHPTLAPTGSIKMVYLENSYGKMTLNSTMSGWIDVSGTEAYYAAGQSGLTAKIWEALGEALGVLDASVDFRDFDLDGDGFIDSITILHSGYGAEWGGTDAYGKNHTDRIWSHRWTMQPAWVSTEGVGVYDYHISPGLWGTFGSQIGRIGVIAHETGHFFDQPDLYDTDWDGTGIGSYGLMANPWGFDGSQLYPPHFSPWCKIRLGWITPAEISQPGTFSVPAAETTPAVYKVTDGYPEGEYLLIENRQPLGFDSDMPQGGLAIWHIDEKKNSNNDQGYSGQAGWPENGRHYRVALLQADGQYGLEQNFNRGDRFDVYHGGGVAEVGPETVPNTDSYQDGIVYQAGHRISGISESGATMTFDFNIDTVPQNPPPVITISAPGDGSTFSEADLVTFTGSASDSEDGDLTPSISWSSSLDGALGTGGSVAATLSVGTHTMTASVTDSGGLSASASIIVTATATSIANTEPSVTISAPADGSTFTEGEGLTFISSAVDSEDGDLGSSLSWSSSLDGALGSGPSISISTLSVGNHTIIASVTDSGGLSGSSLISVTIEPASMVQVTFTSIGAHDGWVRESSENSDTGGRRSSTSTGGRALRPGDATRDRQYKSIVSFDTSMIPAGATIVSATLRMRSGVVIGTNPFDAGFGQLLVDAKTGGFSSNVALQNSDFEAAATAPGVALLSNALSSEAWSEGSLNAAGLAAINHSGTTQFRLYFQRDDNDDRGNDYIGYYSGDNSNVAYHPQLVVAYQP